MKAPLTGPAAQTRRMCVVGYRDMRPVDWVSGKRMPLPPGEGHTCERCGAEHAKVYTVQDLDSRETYEVGSGCAKKSFGFDPERDVETRRLVRAETLAADKEAARQKEAAINAEAVRIAPAIARLSIPAYVLLEERPETVKWGLAGTDVYCWQVRSARSTAAPVIESERHAYLIDNFLTSAAGDLLHEPFKSAQSSIYLKTARRAVQLAAKLK